MLIKTLSTPSEAVWTFYSALSFWAIVKFSDGARLNVSSAGPNMTTIACKSTDSSLLNVVNDLRI